MKLPNESPAAFLTYTFSMLGKIAAADGRVSREEQQRVERYIDEELKLEPKLKRLALEVFADAFDSPLELRDFAQKFKETFPDHVHLADRVIELLICLSMADGQVSLEEEELLRSAALMLGLTLPGYTLLKEKLGFGAC